jgi:3-oxoacyl-[acyl-carrier protein] reductase
MIAREAPPLEAVAKELLEQRVSMQQQVVWTPADVSRPDKVESVVDRIERQFGRLDVLVCNAGVYGPKGRLDENDWDEWRQAIEINLFGTVLCCRAVLPIMRRQQSGRIITLSGGGATRPLPRMSAYASAKAAVVRFTETLAEEVREDGITANAVAPGALNTRLLDEVLAAGPEKVGADFFGRAMRQKVEGGTPLEAGVALVMFLASESSGNISGRLLSAVWDDWQSLASQSDGLAGSDTYTLRRVVPDDHQASNNP